jgi:hypothetical protein
LKVKGDTLAGNVWIQKKGRELAAVGFLRCDVLAVDK